MPFIEAKTNTTLNKDTVEILKSRLAEAISTSFPGKTENWLMIRFEDSCSMFFSGNNAPCMIVNIALFGHPSEDSYEKMTEAVCKLIETECKIPTDRVYVKYEEVDHWG